MRTILHILRKEFLQLKRDPRIIQLVIIGPIMQLMIFGAAINLDVVDVPMVVCDMDNTQASREFVDHFTHSGYFTLVAHVPTMSAIDPYLDNGTASIAIVLPKGFEEKVAGGRPVNVQALVDGSESNAASVGLNYATMVVGKYTQNVLLQGFNRRGLAGLHPIGVDPEVRVWYNPELKSRNFLLPGILALILMTSTGMLTALAIVKEKEIGTMEQLIVTPIKPYQLIIGKLVPFVIIGMIDVALVVLGTTLVFDVPLRGSVLLLFSLSGLFILTTLGIGLFVSTISRTQQQAMMTAMFFVMMPMNFLSGFIFPIENMPKVIQWISLIFPLRYFFDIVRGIFLRGNGIAELWPQVIALMVFGFVILSAAALRFKKKLA